MGLHISQEAYGLGPRRNLGGGGGGGVDEEGWAEKGIRHGEGPVGWGDRGRDTWGEAQGGVCGARAPSGRGGVVGVAKGVLSNGREARQHGGSLSSVLLH